MEALTQDRGIDRNPVPSRGHVAAGMLAFAAVLVVAACGPRTSGEVAAPAPGTDPADGAVAEPTVPAPDGDEASGPVPTPEDSPVEPVTCPAPGAREEDLPADDVLQRLVGGDRRGTYVWEEAAVLPAELDGEAPSEAVVIVPRTRRLRDGEQQQEPRELHLVVLRRDDDGDWEPAARRTWDGHEWKFAADGPRTERPFGDCREMLRIDLVAQYGHMAAGAAWDGRRYHYVLLFGLEDDALQPIFSCVAEGTVQYDTSEFGFERTVEVAPGDPPRIAVGACRVEGDPESADADPRPCDAATYVLRDGRFRVDPADAGDTCAELPRDPDWLRFDL